MPRNDNPAIQSRTVSTRPLLVGGVTGGTAPLVGQPAFTVPPFSVVEGFVPPPSPVSETAFEQMFGLDASSSMATPPKVGEFGNFYTGGFTGIPDWGSLNLHEPIAGLTKHPFRAATVSPTRDWSSRSPSSRYGPGVDPVTDTVWNGPSLSSIPGTTRRAKAASYTSNDGSVITTRAVPLRSFSGDYYAYPVTISGSVFPADRGVLAIIHWPALGNVEDFLNQDPLDRVVAAISLGSGASSKECNLNFSDGQPGNGIENRSIFSVGIGSDNNFDPFSYPGLATGQYNLTEIATGVSDYDSSPLYPPWDSGWVRQSAESVPGPGQVRWGTDASVDDSFDPATDTPYGVPVLGGALELYNPSPSTVSLVNEAGDGVISCAAIGQTLLPVNTSSTNFFSYRLPVLSDYSRETGLPHTPRGSSIFTREASRYFWPTDNHSNDQSFIDEGTLKQAGGYDNFPAECYNWQIARFRHSFYVKDSWMSGEDCGSYFLVHFKKELDFERCVRDGVMPWDGDYETYGTVIQPGSDPVFAATNITNQRTDLSGPPGTGPAPEYGFAQPGYHTSRLSVLPQDPQSGCSVTDNEYQIDLNPSGHTVMPVSGVYYFVPRNDDGDWGIKLTSTSFELDNPWDGAYQTTDLPLNGESPPAVLSSQVPVYFSIWDFSNTRLDVGTHIDSSVAGEFGPRNNGVLCFSFDYLGPFDYNSGPGVFDHANVSFGSGITFPGDDYLMTFSTDAKVRAFVKRSLSDNPIQPVDATNGNGEALSLVSGFAGKTVLMHTTSWTLDSLAGPNAAEYGNFVGSSPPQCDGSLITAGKDYSERFLDETYRYLADFNLTSPNTIENVLAGPGIPGWSSGGIPVPVRPGVASSTWSPPNGWPGISWDSVSFFQTGLFSTDLSSTAELQVSGLPDRNQAYGSSTDSPAKPHAGLLVYPKQDYTTDFVPDNTTSSITQPDYSSCTGTRHYVRCFDAAFSNSDPVAVAGNQTFDLVVRGLQFQDFAYVPGGCGSLGDGVTSALYTGIAIFVKIPGLTTWMDIGRANGSGPSKQSPTADGAGCAVIGPETVDFLDNGHWCCKVRVNVGPSASLFVGENDEVPVLVRVTMNELAKDYDMSMEYVGYPGQFGGSPKPGADNVNVRGLFGLEIVRNQ